MPQLLVSLARSTHAPEQSVRPVVQLATHAPLEQTLPAPHAMPQSPQLAGSSRTFTQVPEHCFSSAPGQRAPPSSLVSLAPSASVSSETSATEPSATSSPTSVPASVSMGVSTLSSPLHATNARTPPTSRPRM
jgi:hypothetical protein